MTTNEFEAYEDISPGLAERFRSMVVAEQVHRRRIERRRLMLDSTLELVSKAFGFTMADGFIAAGLLTIAESLPRMLRGDVLRFYVF